MNEQLKLTDMFAKMSHEGQKKDKAKKNQQEPQVIHEVQEVSKEKIEKLKQIEQSEKFIAEIAKKCSLFFQEAPGCSIAEQLWKNEMFLQAVQKYPQLNNEQIERLVERDWRCMPEEERRQIVEQIMSISIEDCQTDLRATDFLIKSQQSR